MENNETKYVQADLKEYREPSDVQTLIFDKDKFNEATAKAWAEKNNFHAGKIDVTEDSIRLRQKDPGDFQEGSFKTIELKDGVKAVIGRKREESKHGEEEEEIEKEKDKEMTKIFKTLKGVEIFRTGVWNGDLYEREDLSDMVNNFNLLKERLKPRLKLGHNEAQNLLKEDGLPAAGYVTNLYLRGNTLYADFSNIPDKIYDLIENKSYNDVSVEINWDISDENTGESFRRVLSAVALLGEEQPAVWDNPPLEMFMSLKTGGLVHHYSKKAYMPKEIKEIMEKEKNIVKEDEIKKLQDENESLKTELSKKEYELLERSVDSKIDIYLKSGKLLPSQKDYAKLLMLELSLNKKTYSKDEKTYSTLDLLDKIYELSEPLVSLKESSKKGELKDISDNFMKAKAYAKEHNVSFELALKAVGK